MSTFRRTAVALAATMIAASTAALGLRHGARGGRIGRGPAHRQRPGGRPGDRRRPRCRGGGRVGRPFPRPTRGSTSPTGIVTAPVTGFPTAGQTAAILTTGDATDHRLSERQRWFWSCEQAGPTSAATPIYDVAILRIDLNVPAGVNCLSSFDFRYLSEEYPEYVGTAFNDAFIAELDTDDVDDRRLRHHRPEQLRLRPRQQRDLDQRRRRDLDDGRVRRRHHLRRGHPAACGPRPRSPRARTRCTCRSSTRATTSSTRQWSIDNLGFGNGRQPVGRLHVGGHHARSGDRRRLRAVHAQAHARDPPGCRST